MMDSTDPNAVQEWWADNPMTYGEVHGTTSYEGSNVEFGTPEFFERLDREFYSWNTPLHDERPFDRIFPYSKYQNRFVLEIGCGMGTMAMNWSRAGAHVTAVDLNKTSIDMTQLRFKLFNLDGDIRQADARELNFTNGEFDFVYSWGVLHHSPNLEKSLAEVMRVLKPGGGFGIMLYNRKSLLYRYTIEYLQGFLHYENRFLSPLELASRYGDGYAQEGNPHTWPITKSEGYDLLRAYSDDVQIRCLGTELDSIFRQMVPMVSRLFPRLAMKAWARRFGWSLWINGHKRI